MEFYLAMSAFITVNLGVIAFEMRKRQARPARAMEFARARRY